MNTLTKSTKLGFFILLQILVVTVSSYASANADKEYATARKNAWRGDIIKINGVEMIAERSYKPSDASIASGFGPRIRFVRAPGMGDKEFAEFKKKFSALLDDTIALSVDARDDLREMSNATDIDFNKFTQGKRSVVAIVPAKARANAVNQPALFNRNGMGADGLTTRADWKKQRFGNDQDGDYGYRKGLAADADAGKKAPAVLTVSDHRLDTFYENREKLKRFASLNGLSLYDLHDLDKLQFQHGGFRHDAKEAFWFFYEGIYENVLQFSHASGSYRGTAFNVKLAAKGNPELYRYFEMIETLEAKGLTPAKGRTFNQFDIITGIIQMQTAEGTKTGPFKMTLIRTRLHKQDQVKHLLEFAKGEIGLFNKLILLDGDFEATVDYGYDRAPVQYRKQLSGTTNQWQKSVVRYQQSLLLPWEHKTKAHTILLDRWESFGNVEPLC